MTFPIVEKSIETEKSDELHCVRLLLLLYPFSVSGKKSTSVDGITKLANLDFLLRYPTYFQRLLDLSVNPERKRDKFDANIKDNERDTVESKMIRFRYGPWDSRYRRWLAILTSKDLVRVFMLGNTIYISLTEHGNKVADTLSKNPYFLDTYFRCQIIYKAVGSKTGTWIKDHIYKTIPEIQKMTWGKEIGQ